MPFGDIPDVEAAIERLRGLVQRDWIARARPALESAVAELESGLRSGLLANQRGRRQVVAAALLLLLTRIPKARSIIVGPAARAGKGLLGAGAARGVRLVGPIPARALAQNVARLGASSGRGLALASTGRAESAGFQRRVRALFREYAEAPFARLPRRARLALERAVEDARPISAGLARALDEAGFREPHREGDLPSPALAARLEREKDRRRADGTKGSPDLEAWRLGTEKAVLDPKGRVSAVILDAWAYREHSIGVFLAAKQARITELVAINPLDDRTTQFCRWVHGRTIKVEKVEALITEYQDAVAAGDTKAAVAAWPFIKLSKKGIAEARAKLEQDVGSSVSLQEIFGSFFARVGLPPYHWLCRTIAVPRESVRDIPHRILFAQFAS